MTIKIEKGVPLPKRRGTKRSKYPFADMEVGDSFFFSETRERVSAAARAYGARTKKKFASRVDGDGCRIWRTK